MANQLLEQQRARYALHAVRDAKKGGADKQAKYATLVRSLPSMILQNGLGQALAYLLADAEGKKDKPAHQLYEQIQLWLSGPVDAESPERVYRTESLIDGLVDGSRAEYQRAQQSALLLLSWMHKFVDAYITVARKSNAAAPANTQPSPAEATQGQISVPAPAQASPAAPALGGQ